MKPQTKTPMATVEQIKNALEKHDFEYWFSKKKIKDAKNDLERELKLKISGSRFKDARDSLWWWKKQTRYSEARGTELTGAEWAKLRLAVLRHKKEIAGLSVEHAAAAMCQYVRTNAAQLNGLMSECHVWRKK